MVPFDKSIGYSHVIVRYKVIEPVVNGKGKVGGSHVGDLIVTNVTALGKLPDLTQRL